MQDPPERGPAAALSRARRALSTPLPIMRNPWLDIPLSDYEGHMALPQVDQARVLADQLAAVLALHRPALSR